MSNRNVSGYVAVNANIKAPVEFDADAAAPSGVVGSLGVSGLTIQELGDDALHQTVLTLTDVAQTVVNGTEYQGTQLYQFPRGRLYVVGVTMNIAQKTTSDLATTLNTGSTGAVSLGTATASATTLASTMVDLMASTAFTSSSTINVAGTAVGGLLSPAAFDGHSTAKKLYLNSAFATTGDVDGDATMTWTGTITITWANLGVSAG
jgi:hypothetical protein